MLGARSIVNFHFFRLREAAEDGFLSEQLGGSEAPPWQRALQLRILLQALLYLGRLEEALRIADELEPLARKIGQSFAVAFCLSTRAWVEFGKAPDLAKLETGFQQVSKSDQKAWFALLGSSLRGTTKSGRFLSRKLGRCSVACPSRLAPPIPGELNSRDSAMERFFDRWPTQAIAMAHWQSLMKIARCCLVSGQPNIRGSWLMLALVIEGLVMLGEQSQAATALPACS